MVNLKRFFPMFQRATTPQQTGQSWFFFGTNTSGVRVNEETALTLPAVYACVRIIGESIAMLPWQLVAQADNGDVVPLGRARLTGLLNSRPNPEMNAFTWRELQLTHLLLWGNAYSEIERDGARQEMAFWPIAPWRVQPMRDPNDKSLWYRVAQPDGGTVFIPAVDMLHFHGTSLDGITGLSVIQLARQSIGLGIAAETFGAAFFGNGASVSGVLKHPGLPSEPARKNMRDSWEQRHGRAENAGRVAVLWEGVDYQQIGIPPEDAQFLQTRVFQVREVARWFRMQLHKLADLERATFSNIEEMGTDFVNDTLLPWITRMEKEVDFKLVVNPRFHTRMDAKEFLRGDIETRYKAYQIGRNWGWLSANDVRRAEDMPGIGTAGDEYLVPLNMSPAGEDDDDTLPNNAIARNLITTAARQAVRRVRLREQKKLGELKPADNWRNIQAKMENFIAGTPNYVEGQIGHIADMLTQAGFEYDETGVLALGGTHAESMRAYLSSLAQSGGTLDAKAKERYLIESERQLLTEIVRLMGGETKGEA